MTDSISSSITVVDKEMYWDPDAALNKVDVWAKQVMKLIGLDDWMWHAKAMPDVLDDDGESLRENSEWVMAMYGPMFQRRKGLGALCFIAEDGKFGYFLTQMTHGSDFYAGMTSIRQFNSFKQVAPLLAETMTDWWIPSAIRLYSRIDRRSDVIIKRKKQEFAIAITTPDGDAKSVDLKTLETALKGMSFTNVKVSPVEDGDETVYVKAKAPLNLFKKY